MNHIENTRYGYKNAEGHRLHVSTVGAGRDHVELAIAGVGDLGWRSLNVPAAEVPSIALAMLKAAGFGQIHEHLPHHDDVPAMIGLAAGHLSDAVHLTEVNEARKNLTRRRDELAKDLIHHLPDVTYNKIATDGIKRAIDMIIQLQDEAAK